MRNFAITALVALVFGFAGAGLWQVSGIGGETTRAYLLDNPEILQDMAEALQRKQTGDRLTQVSDEVAKPFPGAVLGNPQGARTLVKFTDYGCTYCRMSVADVDRLIREDPDLRVVVREWPIFPGSEEAARMGLAAAQQGKYAAYYHAMFAGGPPSPASVEQAARSARLDLAQARSFAASPAADAELAKNQALADALGFSGTPSWVAGGDLLVGAVGAERLADAIAGGAD